MTEYKFTEYFENEVLRKRPYIKKEWCIRVVEHPLKAEQQEHNRYRFRAAIEALEGRIRRVAQEVIRALIVPIFKPTFHDSSRGFCRRRSCHTAMAQLVEWHQQGYRVVVDADLKGFLDSLLGSLHGGYALTRAVLANGLIDGVDKGADKG